jgi:hypothetical protein
MFAPVLMKGLTEMKEKLIADIMEALAPLTDNQLLYILTFVRKLFGSR